MKRPLTIALAIGAVASGSIAFWLFSQSAQAHWIPGGGCETKPAQGTCPAGVWTCTCEGGQKKCSYRGPAGSSCTAPLSRTHYNDADCDSHKGHPGACSTSSSTPAPVGGGSCTITASPNPCSIAAGSTTCSSTISWNTSSQTDIWVRVNGGSRAGPFASVASPGSKAAPWIQAGNTFTFEGVIGGNVACTVNVTGVSPPPPPSTTSACDETNKASGNGMAINLWKKFGTDCIIPLQDTDGDGKTDSGQNVILKWDNTGGATPDKCWSEGWKGTSNDWDGPRSMTTGEKAVFVDNTTGSDQTHAFQLACQRGSTVVRDMLTIVVKPRQESSATPPPSAPAPPPAPSPAPEEPNDPEIEVVETDRELQTSGPWARLWVYGEVRNAVKLKIPYQYDFRLNWETNEVSRCEALNNRGASDWRGPRGLHGPSDQALRRPVRAGQKAIGENYQFSLRCWSGLSTKTDSLTVVVGEARAHGMACPVDYSTGSYGGPGGGTHTGAWFNANAADFAGKAGAPVRALKDGRVCSSKIAKCVSAGATKFGALGTTCSSTLKVYGDRLYFLADNGTIYYYAHINTMNNEGKNYKKGDIIAAVAKGRCGVASHAHIATLSYAHATALANLARRCGEIY